VRGVPLGKRHDASAFFGYQVAAPAINDGRSKPRPYGVSGDPAISQ